jgi:hypothetical protein
MAIDGTFAATVPNGRVARLGVSAMRLAAMTLVLAVPTRGAERGMTFGLDRAGLRSLKYDGYEYAERGAIKVNRVQMVRWDGSEFTADSKERRRELDSDLNLLILGYSWGQVACMFAVEGDRLSLTIDVSNYSDTTIADLEMELGEMRFPGTPKGWVAHWPYRAFNLGWPTINVADCGRTVIAVCNEDVGRPLMLGWAGSQSTTRRKLVLATSSDWMQEMLDPLMYRPIYPGDTDRYKITIRFSGQDGASRIAADLRERFARAHPYKVKWTDRRPIGALHLSTSKAGRAKNPRGWFNGSDEDFVSAEGRAAFREKVLAYARQCAEILKSFNAQGMITWDIEGQEYPHATSYIDEFGRASAFRSDLRERGERYVLDVPSNTRIRDLRARRPRRRSAKTRRREVPFVHARAWADAQPRPRWERFTVRAGEKGPIEVEAVETRVRAMEENRIGPEERLVVIRSRGSDARVWYVLTNADDPLATIVWVHGCRHQVEQVFGEAKGEAGLDHYEVRSWVGWHHHMTLSLLALWFLHTEARRLEEKAPGSDGAATAPVVLPAAS